MQQLFDDYIEARKVADAGCLAGSTLPVASNVGDCAASALGESGNVQQSGGPPARNALQMPTAAEVQWRIRLRELRHDRFASDLMSDPVWGILLELLLSQILFRQVSIKCATIAARVPAATAHRHIARLEEHGLLYRFADRLDRRRTLLALTDKGLRTIAGLFAESRAIALCQQGIDPHGTRYARLPPAPHPAAPAPAAIQA